MWFQLSLEGFTWAGAVSWVPAYSLVNEKGKCINKAMYYVLYKQNIVILVCIELPHKALVDRYKSK